VSGRRRLCSSLGKSGSIKREEHLWPPSERLLPSEEVPLIGKKKLLLVRLEGGSNRRGRRGTYSTSRKGKDFRRGGGSIYISADSDKHDQLKKERVKAGARPRLTQKERESLLGVFPSLDSKRRRRGKGGVTTVSSREEEK